MLPLSVCLDGEEFLFYFGEYFYDVLVFEVPSECLTFFRIFCPDGFVELGVSFFILREVVSRCFCFSFLGLLGLYPTLVLLLFWGARRSVSALPACGPWARRRDQMETTALTVRTSSFSQSLAITGSRESERAS